MTTLRTRLRRIFRINRDDRNPGYRRFVFDESSQLVETPTAHPGSLILPEPSPFADAGQVFNVDAHCEQAKSAGATILTEPEDGPPGRRYRAEDLEGHRWMFMQREKE